MTIWDESHIVREGEEPPIKFTADGVFLILLFLAFVGVIAVLIRLALEVGK